MSHGIPAHRRRTGATATAPAPVPATVATPAPAPDDSAKARTGGGIVAVLAFTGIVVAVMQTLVVPLIAELPKLLHTSTSNASWVITATLLAGAVATPVMGRLGDMFGKRRILFVSLGLLVAGSAICASTSSLVPMVVGRALQGGAMGVIPLGISIMRDELPAERMGSAMALMSSSLGVGSALGMPAAALVAEHADWHVLFMGSGGLALVGLVLAAFFVPESPVRTPGRFDFAGAVGLSAGLVCLLLAISKGSDWGWGSATTLGLFAAAVIVLLGWGAYELRVAQPLVDLRTTARRQVLLTNLAGITIGFAMYAMSLVLPQLLQLPKASGYGLGQSMVSAGLCVAPGGVVMVFLSPVSARLSARRGPKVSLMAGAVVTAVGYALGLWLVHQPWQTLIVSAVIGAGIALAYAAMPALIMGAVPPSETAAANGLNTLMRSIGTSTASAVLGVVLTHMTQPLGGVPLPSMNAFRTSFLIAVGGCVAGLLIAAFLPGRRPAPAAVAAEVPEAAEEAAPAGPGFHGRVRTAQGTPLERAGLTLVSPAGRQIGRALTRPDGGYALQAPRPGGYVLIATADGHQPQAVTVRTGTAPVHHDIVLAPTAVAAGLDVHGTVRARRDGRPLADARLTLVDATGTVVRTAVTGDDGGYRFTGLPAGEYSLIAGGYPPVATALAVAGGTRDHVDVELLHPADH
ncbi:integral membrane efflux protein [Streptantibioticus cattleyicolor NRRL 8057 = DSM 46488]|uniref:Integral membrane efflux protein n=1 Tax=Streptantibioticus cattleyicolor (strain ATCC 35852 / DSM 46488 / JCM 4925 / NBRC 14057 / NRRL 8057) TaxID=1003195 RepID=G8WUE7_STREN|nr:integral membrane efflux protein [Streptantibioticus cattleyicolor NRRL 8057 = DSM 46488]